MAFPAKRLPFLLVAAAIASHSSSSSAASFHVSSTQELTSAIASANGNGEDDTIHLTARVYEVSAIDHVADGANALPSVKADGGHRLSIMGGGAAIVRASGAPAMRLVRVEDGARLVLTDLTLTGGCASGDSLTATWGGAILNYGTLEAIDCTLDSNRAYTNGGAAYNAGSARFKATRFAANSAQLGGGLFNAGSLWVEETVLTANNAALDGGAAYNEKGRAEWSESRLVNNTAGRDGGAMLAQAGTNVMMSDCHVGSNRADGDQDGVGNGGGICALAESFSEAGSVVADNSGDDIAYTNAAPAAQPEAPVVALRKDDNGTVPEELLRESPAPVVPSLELPSTSPEDFTPANCPIEAPKFGDLAMSSSR